VLKRSADERALSDAVALALPKRSHYDALRHYVPMSDYALRLAPADGIAITPTLAFIADARRSLLSASRDEMMPR
jgi:hypothetical protein